MQHLVNFRMKSTVASDKVYLQMFVESLCQLGFMRNFVLSERVTIQLYPDSKSKFSRFSFYSIFANAHLYFFGRFRPENHKYFEIQVKNVKYMSKHVFMTHLVVEFEALAVLLPKVSYKFVPKNFLCNFL